VEHPGSPRHHHDSGLRFSPTFLLYGWLLKLATPCFMDGRAGAAFCGPGVQGLCWRTSRHDSRARMGHGHDGTDVRTGMDSMKRQDVLQRILTVSRGHESRTDIDIPSFSKVLPLNVPECPAMSLYF